MRRPTADCPTLPRISPYPWDALDRIPRTAVRSIRDGYSLIKSTSAEVEAFCRVLQEGLKTSFPVRITPQNVHVYPSSRPIYPDAIMCLVTNTTQTLFALVEAEPELAHRIITILLFQPPLWVNRSQPPPPAMHAALGAYVVASLRKTAPNALLQLHSLGPEARNLFASLCHSAVVVDAAIEVEGGCFGFAVWWFTVPTPTAKTEGFGLAELRAMGDIPLTVRVVAAVSTVTLQDLADLRPGDAYLAQTAWTVKMSNGQLDGDVVLMAATSSTGWRARITQDGKIQLQEDTMQEPDGCRISDPITSDYLVPVVLADAPVVIRIELGAITLTAQQWSELRPGDVIATGHALGERASLRTGGIEIAKGELVDVEGELAVRIRELVKHRR